MNILDQIVDNPAMMFQTAHDAEQEIINTLIELDRMGMINAETIEVPYAPIFHKGAYYAVIFMVGSDTWRVRDAIENQEKTGVKIQFIELRP